MNEYITNADILKFAKKAGVEKSLNSQSYGKIREDMKQILDEWVSDFVVLSMYAESNSLKIEYLSLIPRKYFNKSNALIISKQSFLNLVKSIVKSKMSENFTYDNNAITMLQYSFENYVIDMLQNGKIENQDCNAGQGPEFNFDSFLEKLKGMNSNLKVVLTNFLNLFINAVLKKCQLLLQIAPEDDKTISSATINSSCRLLLKGSLNGKVANEASKAVGKVLWYNHKNPNNNLTINEKAGLIFPIEIVSTFFKGFDNVVEENACVYFASVLEYITAEMTDEIFSPNNNKDFSSLVKYLCFDINSVKPPKPPSPTKPSNRNNVLKAIKNRIIELISKFFKDELFYEVAKPQEEFTLAKLNKFLKANKNNIDYMVDELIKEYDSDNTIFEKTEGYHLLSEYIMDMFDVDKWKENYLQSSSSEPPSQNCILTDSQCKKLKKDELVQVAVKCKVVENKSKGNSMNKSQLCDLLKKNSPPSSQKKPSPPLSQNCILTDSQCKKLKKDELVQVAVKCKVVENKSKGNSMTKTQLCSLLKNSPGKPSSQKKPPLSQKCILTDSQCKKLKKDELVQFAVKCKVVENKSKGNSMTKNQLCALLK